MKEKPTDELDEMLDNTKITELGGYLKENRDYMADDEKTFYY